MIRHEIVTSALRFYAAADPGPFEPYTAICTLVWETEAIVWIVGMHGDMTRSQVRELVRWLDVAGVALVKAHRHPSRRLPFGRVVGDHIEMDVGAAAERLGLRAAVDRR